MKTTINLNESDLKRLLLRGFAAELKEKIPEGSTIDTAINIYFKHSNGQRDEVSYSAIMELEFPYLRKENDKYK